MYKTLGKVFAQDKWKAAFLNNYDTFDEVDDPHEDDLKARQFCKTCYRHILFKMFRKKNHKWQKSYIPIVILHGEIWECVKFYSKGF